MTFTVTEERLKAASYEIFLRHHEADESCEWILDEDEIYDILVKHLRVVPEKSLETKK